MTLVKPISNTDPLNDRTLEEYIMDFFNSSPLTNFVEPGVYSLTFSIPKNYPTDTFSDIFELQMLLQNLMYGAHKEKNSIIASKIIHPFTLTIDATPPHQTKNFISFFGLGIV